MTGDRFNRTSGLLLLVLLMAACNGEDPDAQRAEDPDTLRGEVVEGLSPEELRERAEAMTQEEAVRRGVLDTTIWVEDDLDAEDADTTPAPIEPEEDDGR